MVPIATFLAGALLTLLLPIAILIALSAWYWVFSVRVPETADGSEPAEKGPATANLPLEHPGPDDARPGTQPISTPTPRT